MPIPGEFIDELLARTDIADIIGSYVQLKKSGSGMKGLCPFHTEKTPSFSVNPEMQIYKCFGCGKGGSVLTFIMEIENLPFTDAVGMLAERAGMTVPQQENSGEYINRKKRLLGLNRDAARHFHNMLKTPAGRPARDYLARRGITKASVTKFGIGAAPDDWTLLYDAMLKAGYTKQELIDAGLCRAQKSETGKDKKGAYDFFRNRLMFPVIDVRGDVIAFSGRTLNDEEKSYKYLNSPDTIVFSKGKHLFGLNLARKSKAGMIILVEGNFGVVTLHQAGFDSAVAQLGSAFTPEHARLIAKYTDSIALAFDGDEAGRKATLRALPLIEATGKSVKVIDFGDGDPDDYIRAHGPQAFRILLEHGEDHAQYRLQRIKSKHNMDTDQGRLAYLAEATLYLSQTASRPEREIYSAIAAKTAGVTVEAVNNEIDRIINKRQRKTGYNAKKSIMRPKESVQPAGKAIRYENEASAVAEEGVVRCLMKDLTLIEAIRGMDFKADEFTSGFLAKAFTAVVTRINDKKEVTPALILSELQPGEASHLAAVLDKPETLSESEKALKEYIGKIRSEKYKHSEPDEKTLREIAKMKMK